MEKRVQASDKRAMNHTPGPWIIKSPGNEFWVASQGTAQMIAEVLYDEEQPQEVREVEANAGLIAAAPDLLAVAKGLAAWDGTDDHLARLAEQARAAIAKAEGREG